MIAFFFFVGKVFPSFLYAAYAVLKLYYIDRLFTQNSLDTRTHTILFALNPDLDQYVVVPLTDIDTIGVVCMAQCLRQQKLKKKIFKQLVRQFC